MRTGSEHAFRPPPLDPLPTLPPPTARLALPSIELIINKKKTRTENEFKCDVNFDELLREDEGRRGAGEETEIYG